jgi:trehalose 6-phosphate synthase
MNLVAKEYVACQDPANPGVLILSRFASAAAECTAALLVNPYDPESVGTAIGQALSMPLEERRSRHNALFQMLLVHDARDWGERFLSALTPPQASPKWPSWPKVTEQMALTKKQRVDNIAHIEETAL